jgi:hypothetical protein
VCFERSLVSVEKPTGSTAQFQRSLGGIQRQARTLPKNNFLCLKKPGDFWGPDMESSLSRSGKMRMLLRECREFRLLCQI